MTGVLLNSKIERLAISALITEESSKSANLAAKFNSVIQESIKRATQKIIASLEVDRKITSIKVTYLIEHQLSRPTSTGSQNGQNQSRRSQEKVEPWLLGIDDCTVKTVEKPPVVLLNKVKYNRKAVEQQ